MSDFEKLVDQASDEAYREIRTTTRSVRDKMRALRDEFGYQPTTPKKEENENE